MNHEVLTMTGQSYRITPPGEGGNFNLAEYRVDRFDEDGDHLGFVYGQSLANIRHWMTDEWIRLFGQDAANVYMIARDELIDRGII
jgi:hypothetical protein